MPPSFTVEEIVEELKTNFNCTPSKVIRFSRNKEINMPIVLVLLPKTRENFEFIKKKRLDNFLHLSGITVEKCRPNSKVLQCYTCQNFFHGSKTCFLDPRCVICAEAHNTKDCPIPKESNKVKCCNCGGNHTASYGGCPNRPKKK